MDTARSVGLVDQEAHGHGHHRGSTPIVITYPVTTAPRSRTGCPRAPAVGHRTAVRTVRFAPALSETTPSGRSDADPRRPRSVPHSARPRAERRLCMLAGASARRGPAASARHRAGVRGQLQIDDLCGTAACEPRPIRAFCACGAGSQAGGDRRSRGGRRSAVRLRTVGIHEPRSRRVHR